VHGGYNFAVTIVLALDTAAAVCSVALRIGDTVFQRERVAGTTHSEHILGQVDSVLAEAGCTLADCDAIAFGAGPGSFTGLRIACAVAQGLAWSIERPVVPVGNLQAQAAAAGHAGERVLAACDARLSEIYWAVYDVERSGTRVHQHAGPALAPAAQIGALCTRFQPQVLALDEAVALPAELPARIARGPVLAATIASLAVQALCDGAAVPASLATPLYVRDRVALTVEQRQALRADQAGTAGIGR